jgi:hypothetical protein
MFSNIYLEEFMKGLKYFLLLSLASTILLLSAPAANADTYTFVFTNPDQSAVAGDIVEFDAIITNLDPSNGLYLNSDNVASLDVPLTLDDTAFGNIPWPLSLAGDTGDSYTGALFDVTVSLATAAGTYEGEYQVLGGSDGITYDLLGNEVFTITVGDVGGSSPVPEPSSLLLLLSGMAGLAGTFRRRLIR